MLVLLILIAALPALVNIEWTRLSEGDDFVSLPSLAGATGDEGGDLADPLGASGPVTWDEAPSFVGVEDSLAESGALSAEAPDFDCMIEPWAEVSVRSPVAGRIDAIHVERADRVQAGDLLVELDADLAKAELDVAAKRGEMTASLRAYEARRQLGEKRGARAKRLFRQNAMALDAKEQILTENQVAKFEMEEARDQLALAELQLARERARYDQRRIRSPINGIVADRLMSVGEVVDEETVLELAQIDPLRVEVVLPAIEFGRVQRGMKAAVIPEIPGDEVVVATVRIVDGIIDSASGTFGAELELPNPEHAIPGGLRCRVQFMSAPGDVAQVEAQGQALPSKP